MMHKLFGSKGMLTLVALIALVLSIGVTMLFVDGSSSSSSIFGEVKLKETTTQTRPRLSNYDEFKQQKGKSSDKSWRYRVKIKKENPFLSFYKDEKKALEPPIQKTLEPSSQPEKQVKQQELVKEEVNEQPASLKTGKRRISIKNLKEQNKQYFQAIFRERQEVQVGKALRIILQEPIPALRLPEGAILKGIPVFDSGRIMVRITAGVIGKEVRKLDLLCFDKEDLLEGVFHDTLARQMEEDAKDSLLDEVLDLEFTGSRIAKKATNLTRAYKNIHIEKGKEIFVALPQIDEDKD
jgi:hypothetical protein